MKRTVLLLAVLLLAGGAAFAQNVAHDINFIVSDSALITLDDLADMDFNLTLAGLAGDPPSGTYTDTRYLWYTVLTGDLPGDTVIQASVAPALPVGLTLELTPAIGAGGAGDQGDAEPTITVTAVDQPLVTGIGSCYTGRAGFGTEVVYGVTMANYTGADFTTTLTYTISGM